MIRSWLLLCVVLVVPAILSSCLSKPEPWSPDSSGDASGCPAGIDCGGGPGDVTVWEELRLEERAPREMRHEEGGTRSLEVMDVVVDADMQDSWDEEVQPSEVWLPTCGNGVCEKEESKDSCPGDCCSPCGDGVCDMEVPCEETCPEDCCYCGDGQCGQCPDMSPETVATCAEDCSTCGDGICSGKESAVAGHPSQCLVDCCGSCGDKICKGGECSEDDPEHEKYCLKDCNFACGNGECEGGESPEACPQDCDKFACGNNICEPGEDPVDCPQDCSGSCGDCECNMGESNDTCPSDCGFCGDGTCSTCTNLSETAQFCAQDCCDDGNSCTDDISTLEDGIVTCGHMVNDLANCESDLPCTTGDHCEAGVCVAGAQEAGCDDANPCTNDWCNQATGGCQFDADTGSACDDNDPCTLEDKCEQGACLPGAVDDCDDGNQCTTDACLSQGPLTGCVNQPKQDGTGCSKEPCGSDGVCENGECACL